MTSTAETQTGCGAREQTDRPWKTTVTDWEGIRKTVRASIENPRLGSQGWKMNGAGTREAPGRSRRAAEAIWARDWWGPEQG